MKEAGTNFFSSPRRGKVCLALCGLALGVSACGGGSYSAPPPPPPSQFTIGGTVSGLSGTGLVLEDNGGDNLSVSANGSFTFKTSMTSGGAYKVTVLTQPSSPAQTCTITSGSGTASANVTSVQVACTTVTHTIGGTAVNLVGANGGLQLDDNGNDLLSVNANGVFTFAMSVADGSSYAVIISMQPSNPAQTCAVTNGSGTATADITNIMVDCGHNEWTWMGGSNLANMPAVYGTQGTPSANNTPGNRETGQVWTDTSGNVWIFGGNDTVNNQYNDLWKLSNGEWTWVGGSDVPNQAGIYGTLGMPSAANIPGGRGGAIHWIDSSGNLWLFGGNGHDAVGTAGTLSDLWKYSNGEWTWMGGSNLANQKGVYGTLRMPAPGNVPGARRGSVAWVDSQGNMWLFGGLGYDSAGTNGELNDLWKYSNGEWTWMGGSNAANQKGSYGALGTPGVANIPGGRGFPVLWTDSSRNVWLFGGFGYDSVGALSELNDLWKYTGGQWTWMGGPNVVNQPGEYGTQGTPSPNNIPGARSLAVTWLDSVGNVWLFGGGGYDAGGTFGQLNDLWKYSNGEWTWMTGFYFADQVGTYGTMGTPNPSSIPGARGGGGRPMPWIDAQGNLWFFGGTGYDSAGTVADLSDLWKYEP